MFTTTDKQEEQCSANCVFMLAKCVRDITMTIFPQNVFKLMCFDSYISSYVGCMGSMWCTWHKNEMLAKLVATVYAHDFLPQYIPPFFYFNATLGCFFFFIQNMYLIHFHHFTIDVDSCSPEDLLICYLLFP